MLPAFSQLARHCSYGLGQDLVPCHHSRFRSNEAEGEVSPA